MNASNYARVEMAADLAASFLKSKFSTFDSIDLAMNQFGLNYEDGSAEIFDFLARYLAGK